jgi:amidase
VPRDTAIVMPVTPCSALLDNASADVIGAFYHRALTLTSIAGHCGAPQVALPLGQWQGRPVGLSILGSRGSDRALLELATKISAQATEMKPA